MSTTPNPNLQSILSSAATITTAANAAQSDIDALNTENTNLTAQITSLQDEVTAANTQITSLNNEIDTLNGEITALDSDLDDIAAGRWAPTVFSNLQAPAGWLQPGNVGNTGGGSTQPHGTFLLTPRVDGSTDFTVTPASPYDEFYWYKPVQSPTPTPQRLAWLGVIKTSDAAKSQAIEWEFELSVNGFAYDGGFQLLLKTDGIDPAPCIRHFDYVKKWQKIPLAFEPSVLSTGLTILVEYEIHYDTGVCNHKAITLNGVRTLLNLPSNGKQKNAAGTNYLHYSVQLDTDGKAEPYTVNFNNLGMRVL